jgi:hypothetical protein
VTGVADNMHERFRKIFTASGSMDVPQMDSVLLLPACLPLDPQNNTMK